MTLIRITSRIDMKVNGKRVRFYVKPFEDSAIYQRGFLNPEDYPADWFEVCGLWRRGRNRGVAATNREILDSLALFVLFYFLTSLGAPVLWECDKEQAQFHTLYFARQPGLTFTVLRPGKKYPHPLKVPPWGDDEYIVMLEKISP